MFSDEGANDSSACQSPGVKDIDASQDIVSGVLNGTAYVNVTLTWNYDSTGMDNWCDMGDFAVRFATWDSALALPDYTDEKNAYESYDIVWEPWIVVPRGSSSLLVPFLSKDLYYVFQVAIPANNINVHEVWYSDHANRYSSRAYYFNDQSELQVCFICCMLYVCMYVYVCTRHVR